MYRKLKSPERCQRQKCPYRRAKISIIFNFSKHYWKQETVVKYLVLRENNNNNKVYQPKIQYPAKLPLKSED